MEMIAAQPRVHEVVVLARSEPADNVVLLELHAPQIARDARSGQFVMALVPGGEQAAVALGIYAVDGERIALLFFVCGKRTAKLAALRPGSHLSCLAPLGNGFDLSGGGRDVAIVAGGVGIASVLLPARELLRGGARVRLYYGARTAERLVEAERFAAEGCDVRVATDDGSAGHRGYVTELLVADGEPPELLLACGPTPMLRAVANLAIERGIPAQLSLEETFGCGVGGCWGCTVPIAGSSAQAPSFPDAGRGGSDTVHARVCKEGPVFWAHELRW